MPSININITINEQECQSLLKNQEAMKALYTMLHSLETVFPIATTTSTTTTSEEPKESKPSTGVECLLNGLVRGALKGAESTELKTITDTLTALFAKK